MTYSDFVNDWCDRYQRGICTLDHINRLLAIGRLTQEEYNYIITKKEEVK